MMIVATLSREAARLLVQLAHGLLVIVVLIILLWLVHFVILV